MNSKLIVMLTNHDKTVENALDYFNSASDLNVDCWGFKDVGLPPEKMKELIDAIRSSGKQSFLEVVSYTEEACLRGAELAVDYGFDYLMGTLFFPSVWRYLKDKPIRYMPFVGKVYGSPSVLEGGLSDMLDEARSYKNDGVFGFDLLAYRHNLCGEALARGFVPGCHAPTVIAGSIDSPERIRIMSEISPWGFTMGSALFAEKFVRGGTFRENLKRVTELMAPLP